MWKSNSRSRKICKKKCYTSNFKKLPFDPTTLREGQLHRFLRTLKNQVFFKDERFDKIYPSGSKPASFYGLLKIHKLNSNKDNLDVYYFIYSYLQLQSF